MLDSYQLGVEHLVGMQEINVRFARNLVEGLIRELREQSESSWDMTEELVEQAKKQNDAFRVFVEESVDAYMNLLYMAFFYYREGLKATKS